MAWTAPKTWAAETLTSSDMNLHVRDNELYLKAHVDASAEVHGLPANANVLGNRAAAGQFVQVITASQYEAGAGAWYTLTATFPVAFTTLVHYQASITNDIPNDHEDVGGAFGGAPQPHNFTSSVSAVTCRVWVANGHTVVLRVLAIGT